MANISEYIVRINGDLSPLEKAVREAEQNMERIGKHEWKIRVNTDDAEAQIQPLLKLISDLQLKSDIDLNVARQHDLEDQLELLEKIDKIRNKKPKDQFSGFSEEAYNLAGEVLDKMEAYEEAKAKRQKTNRRDAYYQSAVEEEVKAEREAARAARKLDYFEALFNDKSGGLTSDQRRKIRGVIQEGQEEARKQVERVNKDGRKEKVDVLDYGNFEDGSVFDAEEIYKNTKKGLGKQIQAVKENRADLEKEYKRSKINPYKFREYDDGRGDPKERQRVIDENQKKQANKTVKDVLKDDHDYTASQREGDTESERQFIELLHEEAEADEKAALARKNLESQKTVDDALVQTQKREQELAREYNKKLYESKGVTPTSDEYDSYYDSGVMERYEEQVEEARKAREKLNESMREGQSQADSTTEHTENLEKDTQAAKKNAEANEEAARSRGKVASGDAKGATDAQDAYKRRGAEANVTSEEMSAEDILKRTEAIKEEGEKIKANAKEYEEDVIQAVSYYDSANNLVKLQIKTRKLVPDEEGSNKGRIDTRTYTTNFDQESVGSFTSHITDTKFVDNIQKQAKAQKILTQNIDESSRALERFIAEQKELGTSFNADKVKSLREGLGNIYDQQDLRIWKNEYKAFREEIEASQKASKRSKGQQLSDADISNKNAIRAKNLDEFNSQVQKSSAVTDEFKAKVKELYATLSSAGKSPVLLEDFDKQLKKYQADFKKAESSSRANNEKANTRMTGYVDRLNSWNEDKYVDSVKNKIIGLRTELAELSGGTGNFNLDLNDENVRAQVERIDASMKELKASVKDTDNVLASGISISKLNEQMAQFVSKNHKLTNEYRQDIRELRQELENGGLTKTGFWDDARKNYTRGFDDVLKDFKNLQTRATDEGLVGGVGAFENLGNRVKQMSTNFVAMYFSLYDIVRYARKLVQTVTEINSAQTELRKVSDASQTRIQENFKTSAETAQELGATISDVIKSTSDWARLGYSVDDAETLARNTTLFQTVGDNLTQESASEYMTSIMKGYQYEASDTESIIDKVNEVNLAARLYRNLQIRIGCGLILLLFINPQIAGTPQSQSA